MHKKTEFAKRVARFRHMRGLTQLELSRKAGVNYRSVTNIEQGLTPTPLTVTVKRLAKALNCTMDDLLSDKEPNLQDTRPQVDDGAPGEHYVPEWRPEDPI